MRTRQHSRRRNRRRDTRHLVDKGPLTVDLTPEEILADLDPGWLRAIDEETRGDRTEQAA